MRKILNLLKDFLPAIILSSVAAFDVFIYEPITMYANNIDDFWFDFAMLLRPSLLLFLIAFSILMAFFVIVKYIAKAIKHPALYDIVLSICGACFVCAYVHSNYLTGSLPPLDGDKFDWSDLTANLVSIVVCVVTLAILMFGLIKFKAKKTTKYCMYITSAIFVMLAVSLFSVILTSDALKPKSVVSAATTKNINLSSSDENFFVFLVDAVDSTNFNKIVESNDEYKSVFKDFSYFPDTLSGYSFTRDSIPFIFSGEWNENKVSFPEYSTAAFDNSKFFAELSKQGFNKNFYEDSFVWDSEKVLDFDNITFLEDIPGMSKLLNQEVKYYLYKALPFPLKKFSRIEGLNFDASVLSQGSGIFNSSNLTFYNTYLKMPHQKTDQKVFQFFHLDGGHVPFNLTKDLLPTDDGTYEEKLEATMKIIEAYIKYLKDNDAYDNANIVILADHGYANKGTNRANPILYVKGRFETHDKMIISEKQVSYVDLVDMFIELLNQKSSTKIFSDIPTDGRIRRYIHYAFTYEEHMEEYEQTDKAWNTKALKPTGEEYNL